MRNAPLRDAASGLESRRDHNIAESDAALFAALQIDRTGHRLMAVERATCDAGNLLIVDDGRAVQHYGDFAADERDVEGLPDIRCAGLFGIWRKEAVDTTRVMTGRLCLGLRLYLNFVTAAQIDTAVRIFAAIEFKVQLEVLELVIVDELMAVTGTDDGAVLDRPLWRAWLVGMPAGEVLSIEELDRLAPLWRSGVDECGCRVAEPMPGCPETTDASRGDLLENLAACSASSYSDRARIRLLPRVHPCRVGSREVPQRCGCRGVQHLQRGRSRLS